MQSPRGSGGVILLILETPHPKRLAMRFTMRLLSAVAVVGLLALFAPAPLAIGQDDKKEKKPEKPDWQVDAEEALVGVWELQKESKNVIPKFKVALEDDQLQIQFWARGSDSDEPTEDANDLYLLARYPGSEVDGESAAAFAIHEADYGAMFFSLKLVDDVLTMDGVKIVDDPKKKTNRIVTASYVPEGTSEGDAEQKTPMPQQDEKKVADRTAADEKAKTTAKPEPKRGTIAGRIETGSTLRGRLTLSPSPAKVTPAGGIEVGSANPTFKFANVPEGEYTVTFQGTVNGSSQTLTWPGLEIDPESGSSALSLSVRSAR